MTKPIDTDELRSRVRASTNPSGKFPHIAVPASLLEQIADELDALRGYAQHGMKCHKHDYIFDPAAGYLPLVKEGERCTCGLDELLEGKE